MMGLIPTFAVFSGGSIFAFNEIETGKAHSGILPFGERDDSQSCEVPGISRLQKEQKDILQNRRRIWRGHCN